MALIVIGLAAFAASALTLFSGFGLGTILLPVFVLFFPLPLAIAATAITHLANNIFKLILLGKHASWPVVVRFGLPALVAAFVGAYLLGIIAKVPILFSYQLGTKVFEVSLVNSVIGGLLATFAVFELCTGSRKLTIAAKLIPLGGLVSGFLGGLSGMQGALRAAFLIKAGLSKEAFVATSVVIAVVVDAARITVYGTSFLGAYLVESEGVALSVFVACLSAFVGAILSRTFLSKIPLRAIQITVASLMIVVGALLLAGVL